MTELRCLDGSKARVAFVLVVMLMVLLTACSRDALPEIELSADNVSLPDGGGTVVLRLEVNRLKTRAFFLLSENELSPREVKGVVRVL